MSNVREIIFVTSKRLADVVDIYINCADEFALTDPPDQISSVSAVTEHGTVTVDSTRYDDASETAPNALAIVRVSGGTQLYSWSSVRMTINCASGQRYTPLIRIQLTK